jgi:hypothetical protein
VGFVIGDTQIYDATYTSAAMGLCLGTIAALPVQRKISRVRNGALSNNTAYLASVPLVCTNGDIATLLGKGFITFTAYAQNAGFYWSGDSMLTATTDDYQFLARGRVIDKAFIIAYSTYLQEVDNELPLNTDGTGTMVSTYVAYLQQEIIDAIGNAMLPGKEISGVSCFIDPAQDVVTANEVTIVLSITPVGYSDVINISLGFSLG